ncbi:MAG: class I SAM-dependent methyltransferase, partial [Anaerolineales bacterium]
MDLVHQAMKRFYAHLEPGGVLVAPFMRLWQAGEPLESEWEVSRTRRKDGATIRRVARSRYDPEIECEHTEDLYQVIQESVVLEEELHRRSPATRFYTQEQARRLFEKAVFREVELYSGFSFDPVKSDDGLFTVIGRRTAV